MAPETPENASVELRRSARNQEAGSWPPAGSIEHARSVPESDDSSGYSPASPLWSPVGNTAAIVAAWTHLAQAYAARGEASHVGSEASEGTAAFQNALTEDRRRRVHGSSVRPRRQDLRPIQAARLRFTGHPAPRSSRRRDSRGSHGTLPLAGYSRPSAHPLRS